MPGAVFGGGRQARDERPQLSRCCHNRCVPTTREADNHKPYLDTVVVPVGVNSRLQPSSGVPVAGGKNTCGANEEGLSNQPPTVQLTDTPTQSPITWQEVVTGVRRRAHSVPVFVVVCMTKRVTG